MPYDENLPAETGYLADAPAELRENYRALKDDRLADAGKLQGLEPGHASGNIPVSDGELNDRLNADMLDGNDASAFATYDHGHDVATTTSDGYMSAADKTRLDGIADGAEVNQNAFANVSVGGTTIAAGTQADTLALVAGDGIALTADTANDTVTVATDGVASKIGSSTVGGTAKPIYLNAGTPTAISATAGGTAKPVYLNAGTITAISGTVGGIAKPVYLNAGTITAISGTVGSASVPVYLNAGTVTKCTSVALNASSATKLATARTIYVKVYTAYVSGSGTVTRNTSTGSASFNGTGNITISVGCSSGCASTCVSKCSGTCVSGCTGSCTGCTSSCASGSAGEA